MEWDFCAITYCVKPTATLWVHLWSQAVCIRRWASHSTRPEEHLGQREDKANPTPIQLEKISPNPQTTTFCPYNSRELTRERRPEELKKSPTLPIAPLDLWSFFPHLAFPLGQARCLLWAEGRHLPHCATNSEGDVRFPITDPFPKQEMG